MKNLIFLLIIIQYNIVVAGSKETSSLSDSKDIAFTNLNVIKTDEDIGYYLYRQYLIAPNQKMKQLKSLKYLESDIKKLSDNKLKNDLINNRLKEILINNKLKDSDIKKIKEILINNELKDIDSHKELKEILMKNKLEILKNNNNKTIISGNSNPFKFRDIGDCHQLDSNQLMYLCLSERKTLSVPNFNSLINVFCKRNLDNANNCKKYIKANYKEDLEINFPEIQVKAIQQKVKIKDNYYKILNKKSFQLSKKKQPNFIFKNILESQSFSIEENVKTFLENSSKKYFKNHLNTNKYIESIKQSIYVKFGMKIPNYECSFKSKEVLLIAAYNNIEKKQVLRPALRINCNNKAENEYGIVYIDAINGAIITSIKKVLAINNKGNNIVSTIEFDIKDLEDISKKIPDLYASLTEFYTLFQPTSNFNPNSKISIPHKIIISEQCSSLCEHDYACALKSKNLLCFVQSQYNDSTKDINIVFHEYAHLLVPYFFDSKKISTQNLSLIFHDLADSLAISVTNDNCIGSKYNNNSDCRSRSNNPSVLPRLISSEDSLYNYINQSNSEYQQGVLAAHMFDMVKDLLKSKIHNCDSSKQYQSTYQDIKHWIRLYRTIELFNYSILPCYNCDKDFYLALQNLMHMYLFQLKDSTDENIITELLYLWSKQGFIIENIACTSENFVKNNDCNEIDENDHFAIDTSLPIIYIDSYNKKDSILSIKGKTGFGFKFDSGDNLKNHNNCSQYIKLNFSNNDNKVSLEYKIPKNKFDKFCNFEDKLKISSYDSKIQASFKNLFKPSEPSPIFYTMEIGQKSIRNDSTITYSEKKYSQNEFTQAKL